MTAVVDVAFSSRLVQIYLTKPVCCHPPAPPPPPQQEGYKRLGLTVPDVKAEDFRDLKVSLRFGFEARDAGAQSNKKGKPPIMVEFTTPWALCYPPGTRARGCQELITPQEAEAEAGSGGGAPGLPCTVSFQQRFIFFLLFNFFSFFFFV